MEKIKRSFVKDKLRALYPQIASTSDLREHIEQWKNYYLGEACITLDSPSCKVKNIGKMNLSYMYSHQMTKVLFGNKFSISVDNHEGINAWLQNLLENTNFYQKFIALFKRSYEPLGGFCITPYIDQNKQLNFNFLEADMYLPLTWTNDYIQDCVLVNIINVGANKYLHLQEHRVSSDKAGNENVTVYNRLFAQVNAADKMFSNEIPYNQLFEDHENLVTLPNQKTILPVYIKTPYDNNIDFTSPLGVSAINNSIDTLESINLLRTLYHNEAQNGAKLLFIPTWAYQEQLRSDGTRLLDYSGTDTTYPISNTADCKNGTFKDFTTTLRFEDFNQAINDHLRMFCTELGIDANTYTWNNGAGVISNSDITDQTSAIYAAKVQREGLIRQMITKLIENAIKLFYQYGGKITGVPSDITDMQELEKVIKTLVLSVDF